MSESLRDGLASAFATFTETLPGESLNKHLIYSNRLALADVAIKALREPILEAIKAKRLSYPKDGPDDAYNDALDNAKNAVAALCKAEEG